MSLQTRNLIKNSTPFQTLYTPPMHSCYITFPENSDVTKQEFKAECDINVIMAKYQHTGDIPNLKTLQPVYSDCTGLDYMEHMNKIVEANNLFADLPSKIRNRFNNDPSLFLDFVHNPENVPEMQTLGLLRPVSPVVSLPPETDNPNS